MAKGSKVVDVAALMAAAPKIDTSFVITDLDTLCAKAAEAMGDFAGEAISATELLASWVRRKTGSATDHIFMVHPLMLEVVPGLNSRDFSAPDMIERVAELTRSVAEGVNTPIEVFVHGDRLGIVGGETRYRSVLHAWVLKGQNPALKAPVGVPIKLEAKGTNDARRHLNVVMSNDQLSMKPVQVARKYQDALRSGMTLDAIAAYVGKDVKHVESYIDMLAMPEALLNVVTTGLIALTVASNLWKQSGGDADTVMGWVAAADIDRQKTGAKKIMPKNVARSGGGNKAPKSDVEKKLATLLDALSYGVLKTNGDGKAALWFDLPEMVEVYEAAKAAAGGDGWDVPKALRFSEGEKKAA